MLIKNATYDKTNGCLVLQVSSADAYKFMMAFKPAEYELKKTTGEKRSNNANAYAWALIREIARKMQVSPVQVYRYQIGQTAVKNEYISMPTEAVERFKEAWTENHLGRDFLPISDDAGITEGLVVYGSSDFSKAEMMTFLNGVIEDCRALNIETEDPAYIESLLKEWKAK